MTTIYTNNNTIEIPFPENKFNLYLKEFNVSSKKELSDISIFWITQKSYQDFKKGTLSLDDFSNIGGYLFNKVKEKPSHLSTILLEIGELSFYIRNVDPKLSELKESLLDIDKYFKNTKNE
jgi:hypothetical protein